MSYKSFLEKLQQNNMSNPNLLQIIETKRYIDCMRVNLTHLLIELATNKMPRSKVGAFSFKFEPLNQTE